MATNSFTDVGGGPAVDPNKPTSGTNVMSGFAGQYTPSGAENIWQQPWMILDKLYPGMNSVGAGYNALRNLNADPMSLYEMIAGRTGALAGEGSGGTGTGDYINWLANLYKNLGTVGGRGFSAGEMLRNLFNPGGDNTSLNQVLVNGDGPTQMRTLFNMAKDATSVGMNPLAARGYQGALSRAGDKAISMMSSADAGSAVNNMPIYQLIKQIAPGLIPG